MTDQDQMAFLATFTGLRKVFNLRGEPSEVAQVSNAYFAALRRFSLHQVTLAADILRDTCQHFPKPVEWIRAIPRSQNAGLMAMIDPEAGEHRRAVQLGYEDEPCNCHDCRQAGVSHRMLRYVPDTDSDDRDVKMLLDGKPVCRGHWAHGEELKRWYKAREDYFALRDKFAGRLPRVMKKPLELAASGARHEDQE